MTTLSDTKLLILSAAAQRPDNVALPLPASLRGGAAAKVVNAMLANGLLAEVEANVRAGEPMWRETGDGHGVTLVATKAGLYAIGVEEAGAQVATQAQEAAPAAETAAGATEAPTVAPMARTQREGTKQATLIAMLRAPEGATVAEISSATGWKAHTVRGAIAGALKKKLGLDVTTQRDEARGRVYRIAC